jgi:hypothetical protein
VVGSSSKQSLTLTNSGTSALTVTQAVVTGKGFAVSGPALPLMLPAGQSVAFTTTFTPTGAGSASGIVSITGSGQTPGAQRPTGGAEPSSVTTQTAMIAVNGSGAPPAGPLQISSGALPNAQAGVAFQASLAATGGVQPYHWTVTTGTLPSGLSLGTDTGVISGTTTQGGQSGFSVQVTDSSSPAPQTAMKALTLSVLALALQISPGNLADGQVGVLFDDSVSATGGVAPYTWSIASGALPSGLTLSSSSGTISGTPTGVGSFNFDAEVTDSTFPMAQTATQHFTVTVNTASPTALTVSVPLISPATQGVNYWSDNATTNGGAILAISGGVAPYVCSTTSGSIPAGMSVSVATPNYTPTGLCVISGTPTTAGSYSFTEQVRDSVSNIANASVTFLVISSNLPVISNVKATAITATTATITWTTNVAADSQVAYGNDYYFLKTAEQDSGGVTLHSVNLTGLTSGPGQSYLVAVLSKGISGGAPQPYLLATDTSLGFATGAAASTGTFDFGIEGAGPNNVIQGYPMYVDIYNWIISGSANWTLGTYKIQVTGIPANSQVHWPDQQDDGLGQCSISTTKTTNDSLTCWSPTANTQFEILTNVGGTTPVGSYTLTVTATTNKGSGPSHSFTWPMSVGTASFPSGSPSTQPPIPALALWQTNMTTYGAGNYYLGNQRSGTPCFPHFDQCIDYYDGQWVYYQIGTYTKNLPFWTAGANNSRTLYRDGYVIPNGGQVQGYWIFPHGLYYDCMTNGNASSCTALNSIATQGNGAGMIANGIPYADALNIREAAYMLGAKRLNYDAGGGSTLAQVKAMAAYCLGIEDQIVNSTAKWEQPFMDGLLAQALIEYYLDPNTGNGDPRVPPAIKALADYLWTNDWLPWNGTNGTFFYNNFQWKIGLPGQGTSLENLNLLIAPMYAWLYLNTGLSQYQLEGDTIWAAGVNDPPGDGIGWSGKNFSQQYRWSFDYVKWRSGP